MTKEELRALKPGNLVVETQRFNCEVGRMAVVVENDGEDFVLQYGKDGSLWGDGIVWEKGQLPMDRDGNYVPLFIRRYRSPITPPAHWMYSHPEEYLRRIA
jgi:hypothetical protein